MRIIRKYHIENVDLFKEKLLCWTQQYSRVAYLDSHHVNKMDNSKKEYNSYELLVGVDQIEELDPSQEVFPLMKRRLKTTPDWWFGFLSYDLKNQVEDLTSENHDGVKMPQMHLFRPRWVFLLRDNLLEIHTSTANNNLCDQVDVFNQVNSVVVGKEISIPQVDGVKARISKKNYLDSVEKLQEHIQRGDIYEVNFCQEYFSENTELNPFITYRKLKQVSPTPYSCFYKLEDKFLLSASPERFIKKKGSKIISQPIKGTAPRGKNQQEDQQIKEQLFSDPKERAENIMIVDLVRNDLSRTARKGSVCVEELCGIYSFPQVHQMISTVVSQMREDAHFVDVIENAFPMGSMTGAPKVRAMKLIEKYESTRRGLYSGAVGYISPEGDFDFNVVIRSILYNATQKYLSFMVGGAITMRSVPEKEYQECLLKAKAILKVLGCSSTN